MKLILMYNYFVLNRVYESILKLNPILEKYGFVFESYDLKEFILKFDQVLSFGAKLKDRRYYLTFFNNSPMFDFYVTGNRPMIILRNINSLDYTPGKITPFEDAFVKKLITILRLYKSGMIEEIMVFQYDITSKECPSYGFKKMRKDTVSDEYIIEDNDVEKIDALLQKEIVISATVKLAFDSFNEYYEIKQSTLKYVTLMTALESIFNQGNQQIAHTCSRHLSILISENVEEFNENYKSMKKLYDFRSKIVHGIKYKDIDIKGKLSELERYVRIVLNILLYLDISKDELFIELNCKGF